MTQIEYPFALYPIGHPPSPISYPIFLLELVLTEKSVQHSLEPRHHLLAAPANCLVSAKHTTIYSIKCYKIVKMQEMLLVFDTFAF
jgi:hypothetical protein